MSIVLRRMVLHNFKKLHRARLQVFDGDERALIAARTKINEEFNKNKHVKDEDAVKAMIQFAEDVEKELRTQVIQAKEVKPGVFGKQTYLYRINSFKTEWYPILEAKITNDTLKIDNIQYNDNKIPDDGHNPCCQDEAKKNTEL